MSALNLTRVTLAAVASTKINETVTALKRSMRDINFYEVLLFTDEQISLDHLGIKVISIEKLDYKGYNHFVIYRLKEYIQSDFVLLIQYDGYVLRSKEWSDEFLKYDYIGAPWQKNTYFTQDGKNVRVGNGGFSLRSMKLLETPSNLSLDFDTHGTGHWNEDGMICLHYRNRLENSGVKFAPVEIASKFSREVECEDSYAKSFGYHSAQKSFRLKLYWKLHGIILDISFIIKKIENKLLYEIKYFLKIFRRNLSAIIYDLTPAHGIAQYREKIKVYDIFTFHNELDLLEIRLNILAPYVDYFVIIEATETFSGLPKPLYFQENKERFKKWEDKIIHFVVDDTPKDEQAMRDRLNDNNISQINRDVMNEALVSTNVGRDRGGKIITVWLREFYQKESIKKALIGLKDNDICYVSDVDEIWSPEVKIDYRKDCVYKLKQKMYAYYLNNRSNEAWIGPIVTKYKNIRDSCLNNLRTEKKTKYVYVNGGGWHFTNQGGADQIRKKLESYGHQEYNTIDIKSQIENKIENNQDFIGRKFKFWIDENDLPKYLIENKEKFNHLFK